MGRIVSLPTVSRTGFDYRELSGRNVVGFGGESLVADDETTWKCGICGANESMYNRCSHTIMRASEEGEPLAFTISAQGFYDEASHKARLLALARKEMKEYFPGKEFEIQPTRYMLTRKGENGVLLGESHVAIYIAFER